MKKVSILIPYFGKWPPYLGVFLESCRYNPELTILIFTDLKPPDIIPPNVEFHHTTLDQIKNKLDDILGFETAPLTPYKLCDVRPAFGLIFQDYIEGFDFWGWGDIDVLFGRIRAFGIADLLCKYDVISFRRNWISGSFCILRNDEQINTLLLSSKDLKRIYLDSRHLCFDEISFCWDAALKLSVENVEFPYDNFTRLVVSAASTGKLVPHFNDLLKESISRAGYLMWDRGRILDHHGKEHLLYHYVTEKKQPYFKNYSWTSVPQKFYIDRTGFYSKEQFQNRNLIGLMRIVRSVPVIAIQFFQKIKNRVGRYLRNTSVN